MTEKHEGMKKLTFWVDENLHSELKLAAMMEAQPMQSFIVEALDEHIDIIWRRENRKRKFLGRFRIEKDLNGQTKPKQTK